MQQELARKRHWTLADIPWPQFDAAKVDAETLKIVKAAALVEHNGGDYGTYLCNVFHDDPEFEVVARCIVETGTSSYYTALGEAVDEPVLKEICRNIAADEHRHYKLFYDHLRRYLKSEKLGRLRRLAVALGRL